jgi:hypothetical protein
VRILGSRFLTPGVSLLWGFHESPRRLPRFAGDDPWAALQFPSTLRTETSCDRWKTTCWNALLSCSSKSTRNFSRVRTEPGDLTKSRDQFTGPTTTDALAGQSAILKISRRAIPSTVHFRTSFGGNADCSRALRPATNSLWIFQECCRRHDVLRPRRTSSRHCERSQFA